MMKRKLLIGLLALTCASSMVFGLAACTPDDGNKDEGTKKPSTQQPNYDPPADTAGDLLVFELNEDESGYIVKGLAEGVTNANIKIPATYNNLPVVAIGERAFGSCDNLKSVTISEGVSEIGSGAFTSCVNMPSFKFPDSIKVIGDAAFMNCSGLMTLQFNETSQLEEISASAFQSCVKLIEVDIPDSVVTLGDRVFQNCTALKTVTIGDAVETIGVETFRNCTLLETVTIGNSLKEVGAKAFLNCSIITEIHFPLTLEKVGLGALQGCTGIKKLTIPFVGAEKYDEPVPENEQDSAANTTNFGYIFGAASFRENHSLKLDALETVTITGDSPIGYHAFQDIGSWTDEMGTTAIGLSTINITGNVKVFGTGAFAGCHNLRTLVMPKSVTKVGGQILADTLIRRVFYCGSLVDWHNVDDGGYTENMQLYGRDAYGNPNGVDPRYFYSEEQPTTTGTKYWHYVDGEPVIW